MSCLTSQPAVNPPGSDGGSELVPCDDTEQPEHCLYILVCAATTGDLADLFKLGITNHLPTRYRQHTCIWDEFDLGRSALLRLDSRRQIERLEGMLKEKFKGWRRYPGRDDPGFSEFHSMECFASVLTMLDDIGVRSLGGRLIRGIGPAECELAMRNNCHPTLTRDERRELRARRDAARRQAFEKLRAQYEAIMALVLDLALAHEQDLIWVDLNLWRRLRVDCSGAIAAWGLVDLYFDRIGPAPSAEEIGSGRRSAAQMRREESFAPIAALVASMDPDEWNSIAGPSPMGACHLQEKNSVHRHYLPHRICADKPLLRLESSLSSPLYPLFDQFEALARRVENRHWEQLDLC